MKITPITPVYKPIIHTGKHRAVMAINHKSHTVIDTVTGERFELESKEAWKLLERLNNAAQNDLA